MPLQNKIRYWRLQIGAWDLQEFADIVGFSAWLVEKWEQQEVQPTLEALCQVKERLLIYHPGITLDDLIDYMATPES
jgi:hypothetical protein